MAKDREPTSLYSARVNIWVEDELTRRYLPVVWQLRGLKLLDAGGASTIAPAVHDAQTQQAFHVFGIVDGDFEPSNEDRWQTASVFRLPVHEIENYLLLDADALAESKLNSNGRSLAGIEQFMFERASQLLWWTSVCSTIARIRHLVLDGFIERPRLAGLIDRDSARHHFTQSPWLRAFPNSAKLASARLDDWLDEAIAAHQRALADGSWRRTFPGKEIFRSVRGWIHEDRHGETTAAGLDADLAQVIARWQQTNGRVPAELLKLRDIIKGRLGI
jgi:hypothetical protein